MQYAPLTAAANTYPDDAFAAHVVALVGSRLCHDLVSPLGAIGNGVELLQMAGGSDGDEMRLIEDALKAARARINCFRIAFGAAGASQRVSAAEFAALVADIQTSSRLRIGLDIEGDHSRGVVKLVLLSLMCMETAMPWGARVMISQKGRDWRISAQAERTRQDPALWARLDCPRSGKAETGASEVQFLLLPLTAAELDRRVIWSMTETSVEIGF